MGNKKIINLLDIQLIGYKYFLSFMVWTLYFSSSLRNTFNWGHNSLWLLEVVIPICTAVVSMISSNIFCVLFYLTFPSRYSIFSCTSSSLILLSWCSIDLLDSIDFGGYIMKTSQSVIYKKKCFKNIFINFNQLCKTRIYFHTHRGKLPFFLVLPYICNPFWSFSHN